MMEKLSTIFVLEIKGSKKNNVFNFLGGRFSVIRATTWHLKLWRRYRNVRIRLFWGELEVSTVQKRGSPPVKFVDKTLSWLDGLHSLTILTGKDWCFTQFSTGMAGWLLLVFLICLHNQLSSVHSIISTDVWKMWFIK